MEPLQVGDNHPVVAHACLRLGVFPVSSEFTETLAQRLRGWQFVHGFEQDGLLNEEALGLLGIEEEVWR